MLAKQLQVLSQGIEACGELKGVKFAYALAKNKALLKTELETLQTAITPSEKYMSYEKARVALCEVHAEKDEKDKPKMEGNEYVITDRKKFDKELEKLQEEHKEVITEREGQVKEFNELLEKESDYKPFMIEYSDVPEDISSKQMSGIVSIVKEPK